MAKKIADLETSEYTGKTWREGELINVFKLKRITEYTTPLMQDWLNVQLPEFSVGEQYVFDKTFLKGQRSISGWNEEELKVKFIGPVLELGHFNDEGDVLGFLDKIISATIDGIRLSVKSDFMLAKGILDVYETPYFHFQEYKPYKNPSGDSMAQLFVQTRFRHRRYPGKTFYAASG